MIKILCDSRLKWKIELCNKSEFCNKSSLLYWHVTRDSNSFTNHSWSFLPIPWWNDIFISLQCTYNKSPEVFSELVFETRIQWLFVIVLYYWHLIKVNEYFGMPNMIMMNKYKMFSESESSIIITFSDGLKCYPVLVLTSASIQCKDIIIQI